MSEEKQLKQPMNRATRNILIVMASVLAAVMVSFIILAFIPVKGFAREEIQNYYYVNIYDHTSAESARVVVKNESKLTAALSEDEKVYADLFKAGLASTKYSAFRAAFEFNYKGNLRALTDTEPKEVPVWDEDTKLQKRDKKTNELVFETQEEVFIKQYTKEEMLQETTASEGEYVLEFFYSDDQNKELSVLEVKGPEGQTTVEFNRMRVVISDSENAIEEFKMFFYDSDKMNADDPRAASARATAVLVNANTSTFIDNLADLFEYLQTKEITAKK